MTFAAENTPRHFYASVHSAGVAWAIARRRGSAFGAGGDGRSGRSERRSFLFTAGKRVGLTSRPRRWRVPRGGVSGSGQGDAGNGHFLLAASFRRSIRRLFIDFLRRPLGTRRYRTIFSTLDSDGDGEGWRRGWRLWRRLQRQRREVAVRAWRTTARVWARLLAGLL